MIEKNPTAWTSFRLLRLTVKGKRKSSECIRNHNLFNSVKKKSHLFCASFTLTLLFLLSKSQKSLNSSNKQQRLAASLIAFQLTVYGIQRARRE
jgi:hypothetical protein